MWIEFSKIVVCFYFCSTVGLAYHAKNDYSERKLNKKFSISGLSYNNDNLNVRQSSRYPNFSKVMTRIENMNTGRDSSDSKESFNKIRHKGYRPTTTTTSTTTTNDGLFETYGDLENDDVEEYDDMLEDEEEELEYEDDSVLTEDPFFDSIEDVQAEEPTERPTLPPKTVSSLTEFKWRHFGTVSRVEESRRQHLNLRVTSEQRRVNAVLEHFVRVNQQGKCRRPSPKVIQVQTEHPDPSKTYTPHCTVLHRCAEDTGCCKHETNCQYKTRDLVHLYFYTKSLGSTDTKVEKLSFYNHTECECREKSNSTSVESMMDSNSGISFKSADTFYHPPQNIRRCMCPKHFQPKPTYDYDNCSCDCEETNLDCIQLKKGKEHISMTDRICISNDECGIPICEYGAYGVNEGKCPSKKEKIDEFRRIRINY